MAREIPLSKGFVAIVDDQDFERFGHVKWFVVLTRSNQYAERGNGKGGRVKLHRLILDAPPGVLVDHIDGDSLNCTRANLRLCSYTQNNRNRRPNRKCKTGLKGAEALPYGRYRATIWLGSRRTHLGIFDTDIEAARAYDRAAIEHYGRFARLNYPEAV
jgi:hypothetical protein